MPITPMQSTASAAPPRDDPRARAAARLVERIVAADRDAETELAERYRRGLVFMLLELCGNRARAEDLAQETLRRAIEKLRAGELREPEKLPGFLRGMARNLLRGERRLHVNRPAPDIDELPPTTDPRPDPEAHTLRRHDALLVRRLLAALEPPRDREILSRFYLLEHSREEICADLDLSRIHFNRVIHRARGRFRLLLEGAGMTEVS